MAEYSIARLANALQGADAAGDVEAARKLANQIQTMQRQEAKQKQEAEFGGLLAEQAKEYNPVEAAMIGAGKTFTDLGRGAKNLYAKATGDEEMQADLARKAELEGETYAPLAAESPKATLAGEMLPYLATAPLGGGAAGGASLGSRALLGTGRGLAGRMGEQAAISGALGGLTYGEDQGTTAGISAGLGALMPALGKGAGVLSQRAKGAVSAAREATEAGIPLTPGQRIGSKVVTKLEEVVARMPGLGTAFESISRGQQRAINRLASTSIGENVTALTGKVLAGAKARIGRGLDEIVGEGKKAFQIDMPSARGLVQLRNEIIGEELTAPKTMKMVNKMLNRRRTASGMPPARMADDLSRIGRNMKSVGLDPDERAAMKKLRDILNGMAERQMPPKQLSRWTELKGQWRDLKTLEKVTSTDTGNVSGAKLANALEKRGLTDLTADTPLAKAGRTGRDLRPTVPNSGTPTAMLPWMLGAGAAGGMFGEDAGGIGGTALAAMAAPWLYRAGGRALASPLQAGAGKALAAMSQPAAASTAAKLAPGLLE